MEGNYITRQEHDEFFTTVPTTLADGEIVIM